MIIEHKNNNKYDTNKLYPSSAYFVLYFSYE